MKALEAERLARVTLNLVLEPGEPRLVDLVEQHGAAEIVAMLSARGGRDDLGDVIGRDLAAADPQAALSEAASIGVRFVVPGDREWPDSLDRLNTAGTLNERGGAPLGLWVKGPIEIGAATEAVAIVGSRSSTTYGNDIAADMAFELGEKGWTVVSGAAIGIDAESHRGALLSKTPTIAVLACGLDQAYPRVNAALIARIADTGAVVSEAPLGSPPLRIRFLARNRIIAGLARGTVVVEAAHRSGALNTANWTTRLQRVLMGVPGAITSASSGGIHERIRIGEMQLVTSAPHVAELLAPLGETLDLELTGTPIGSAAAR